FGRKGNDLKAGGLHEGQLNPIPRAAHRRNSGKEFCSRFPVRRLPSAVFSAATPIRAPVRFSIDRIRFAKSLVDPGVLAARNKSKAATIDDTRDGLPSPRRRLRDTWRRLFLQQSVFPRWSHGHPLSQQPWQTETRSRSSV